MNQKSFSVDVINRIIIALQDHPKGMVRTRLAQRANMSYDKCLRYLEFLQRFDLIYFETNDEDRPVVRLRPLGYLYYDRNNLFDDF